jgi:hypothetical protein
MDRNDFTAVAQDVKGEAEQKLPFAVSQEIAQKISPREIEILRL